jgi:hypothetical protein
VYSKSTPVIFRRPEASAQVFKIFKFGFNQLHGPRRKIWYDDVAVAPTRSGCF